MGKRGHIYTNQWEWEPDVRNETRQSGVDGIFLFISPLFNQVGQLRTSSHLQLRPGQDKKQSSATQTQSYTWNKQTYSQ